MDKITWKGKQVKTPAGNLLQTPFPALTKALQAEWDKIEKPAPDTMPLTARVAAVIDVLPLKRDQIEADAANYIQSDVLCYFDDSNPQLIEHQHISWDEHLQWITEQLQTQVQTTKGISAIKQSADYERAAVEILQACDDWHFYALQNFILACQSFILGYSLYKGNTDAETAVRLSCADALYQERQWGADEESAARRQALAGDIAEVQNYLLLLQS